MRPSRVRLPGFPPNCGGNHKQGDNLRGIQNTVTNTNCLYLVLAARLFQATNIKDYSIAADREWAFLENWWGRDADPNPPISC